VNDRDHQVSADADTPLLYVLRGELGLNAAKFGCGLGQCGACTVLVDGNAVFSCLMPIRLIEGKRITTLEGLGTPEHPGPMQQAFIDQDAFQCGYCTPGQIMSAIACVHEGHAENDNDIREYMSGNLCRCAAYPHIVAAVKQAKSQMKGD